MKTFITCLYFILCSFPSIYSQEEDFTLWKEGKKYEFNTTGNSKSKGLNLSIKFPNNWTAKEGNRPNIVQKFHRNNKPDVTAMILIKTFDPPLTEQEIKDAQTEEQMKTMVPKNGTYLKSNTSLKIDGETAFSLEYYLEKEGENNVSGLDFKGYTIEYIIIYKSYYIMINFGVATDSENPDEDLNAKFEKFKLAFAQIVNSVIILSKWQ